MGAPSARTSKTFKDIPTTPQWVFVVTNRDDHQLHEMSVVLMIVTGQPQTDSMENHGTWQIITLGYEAFHSHGGTPRAGLVYFTEKPSMDEGYPHLWKPAYHPKKLSISCKKSSHIIPWIGQGKTTRFHGKIQQRARCLGPCDMAIAVLHCLRIRISHSIGAMGKYGRFQLGKWGGSPDYRTGWFLFGKIYDLQMDEK